MLKEWKQTFNHGELTEVKEQWEDLQKRPDIPVKEQEWWDDYAKRKSIQQNELETEELIKEQEKVEKFKEKNKKLWSAINNFKKNERIRRYALSKPVLTIKQAREAIAELLQETEREWEYYLQNIITDLNFPLDLSLWEKDKEKQVQQVLEWIKEARNTLDYEKLFERWNGEKEYSEKYDFDGSLFLLKEWLKVKDFEPPKSQ